MKVINIIQHSHYEVIMFIIGYISYHNTRLIHLKVGNSI
jgi:hypothetical protein